MPIPIAQVDARRYRRLDRRARPPLPENCCVAMNSGWDRYVDERQIPQRGRGRHHALPGLPHRGGTDADGETSAVGMAVDTLSLDFGPLPPISRRTMPGCPPIAGGLECIAESGWRLAGPRRDPWSSARRKSVVAPAARRASSPHGLTSPIPQPGSSCPCLSRARKLKNSPLDWWRIGYSRPCSGKLPRSAAGPWFRGSQDSCATSSWPRIMGCRPDNRCLRSSALRLPNHFRTIFGEGAFNAAIHNPPKRRRREKGPGYAGPAPFRRRDLDVTLVTQIALLALALAAILPWLVACSLRCGKRPRAL